MLYPSIAELTKHDESRYALVIAVSKRARQIAEENKGKGNYGQDKPVMLAIEQLADETYHIVEQRAD